MRTIAIDALGISQPGGGRSATINVLEQLLRQDAATRYIVYLDQPEPALALGPHVEQRISPCKHRVLSRVWAQVTWPLTLRRDKVDLIHHIKNLVVAWPGCRRVVTIYDVTMAIYGEMYSPIDRVYWQKIIPFFLRRMNRIIAISDTTAADLQHLYGISLDLIRVIYPAFSPRFCLQSEDACRRVREQYSTGDRFVLHVGSISRKKNLLVLLKAFELVRETQPDLKLVLVGRSYDRAQDEAFFDYLDKSCHRDAVILTGPIPDEDMPPLNAAATVMVFPSLHEGFGIAPLEAMACGTPAITSAGGALPEVVGGGAVIVNDVSRPEPLAQEIARATSDQAWHDELAERGLHWVRRYSAREAASKTIELYDVVMGDGTDVALR